MKQTLKYNTNIDTHSFTIISRNTYELQTDIQDIEDLLTNYTISNKAHIPIHTIPEHIEGDNKQWFYRYHIYYNNNIFNPLFNISFYKMPYGGYTITFNFYGLTQYNKLEPTLTVKCLDRRRLYKSILGHMLNEDIDIQHKRIDICVDIQDIDFNTLAIINSNGIYRKPDIVENRDKNLYSREREVYKSLKDEYKHVHDRAMETTQIVLNTYDKSNKGGYEYNMARVEYKLYKRGIRSIVNEDNIDIIQLEKLLDRYRVLSINNVNKIMYRYVKRVKDMRSMDRRIAGDAMIAKYGIYDFRDDVKNVTLETLNIGRYTHEE